MASYILSDPPLRYIYLMEPWSETEILGISLNHIFCDRAEVGWLSGSWKSERAWGQDPTWHPNWLLWKGKSKCGQGLVAEAQDFSNYVIFRAPATAPFESPLPINLEVCHPKLVFKPKALLHILHGTIFQWRDQRNVQGNSSFMNKWNPLPWVLEIQYEILWWMESPRKMGPWDFLEWICTSEFSLGYAEDVLNISTGVTQGASTPVAIYTTARRHLLCLLLPECVFCTCWWTP